MSATWDTKNLKATPVAADEVLIIDTADGRNQKRATLSSFGVGIWSRNSGSGFIFPTTLTDLVGIGNNIPFTDLTIFQNSDDAKKGITLSGDGIGVGGSSTTDGVVLLAGNITVGNMQLWVGQKSDVGNGGKNFFRYIVGVNVPTIDGVNGDNSLVRNINIGGLGGKVGIGFTAATAVQTDIKTQLHVRTTTADTVALITREVTGTNGGITATHITDTDPNGRISAAGGAECIRDSGVTSKRYLSKSLTTDTIWHDYSTTPPDVIEINSLADFDDLASVGVVTFTTTSTLALRSAQTTANRIVVDVTTLNITSNFFAGKSLRYSASGNFITIINNGSVRIFAGASLIGTGTGTFMNLTGTGTLVIRDVGIIGWDNMGTFDGGSFINNNMSYINIDSGWTITNPTLVTVDNISQVGTPLNDVLFTLNTNNPNSAIIFNSIGAVALASTASLLDLSTKINNTLTIVVSNSTAGLGNIFKQPTAPNATINSVADSPLATGTITAFADDVTGISTTVFSTTTYFEDEELTLSANTSYNGTFQIFGVVAGVSFKIRRAFVADDATGSIETDRITMTLQVGHNVTTGMSIKVIDSQFYNIFYTVLNLTGDVITLNDTFILTDTGTIERNVSLDETDPRILATNNSAFPDSKNLANGNVNANTTDTTVLSNTYSAINVTGFTIDNDTERFRLINAVTATFRYIGKKTFFGSLTAIMSAKKTTSMQEYRFAMSVNGAVPVFATARYVPLEVKTAKITFPLRFKATLNENDTIQIMQAGEGHTDSFTIEDIEIGVTD